MNFSAFPAVFQHAPRQSRVLRPLRLRRSAASPAGIVLAAAPSVPIKFQIQYKADFGQVLKIVGAGDILGEWTPKDAPGKHIKLSIVCPYGKHQPPQKIS